jgi:signal transduction histidine kinase
MKHPHHDRGWLILGVIGIAQLLVAFAVTIVADRVRRSLTRVDDYARERSAQLATEFGLRASAAAPISVNGQVWGMLHATSGERPLPAGTEHRLQQLATLVDSAIANAESRAQLTASRARVVAMADETRRQLQRELHDGAQQRLVLSIIALKLAKAELADSGGRAAELVDEALLHADRATAELRDLVRGILPAALILGGLRTGVESLIDQLPMPVEASLDVPRLPAHVETTAYFVIAEALTNAVKHAHATKVLVSAVATDDALLIDVQDDGRGGADAAKGSGLVGLFDRVQAAAGTLSLSSQPGQGTKISTALPLGDPGPDRR